MGQPLMQSIQIHAQPPISVLMAIQTSNSRIVAGLLPPGRLIRLILTRFQPESVNSDK